MIAGILWLDAQVGQTDCSRSRSEVLDLQPLSSTSGRIPLVWRAEQMEVQSSGGCREQVESVETANKAAGEAASRGKESCGKWRCRHQGGCQEAKACGTSKSRSEKNPSSKDGNQEVPFEKGGTEEDCGESCAEKSFSHNWRFEVDHEGGNQGCGQECAYNQSCSEQKNSKSTN